MDKGRQSQYCLKGDLCFTPVQSDMNFSFDESNLRNRSSALPSTGDLSLLSLNAEPAGTAGNGNQEGHGSQPSSSSEATHHDPGSWTYLVNLTATMLPDNQAGSGYKFNQLRNLKDLTRNSNSEVIVQEFDAGTGMLERYELAHGEIHNFQPVKSAGTAADLQSLLAAAPRGGQLALINEAHGNGDLGFEGDAGKLSVNDFERAIKTGLASTGRTSLDVLSMDSCLMANVQVLCKVSGLAKNVVASELEEFSSVALSETPPATVFDMQPIDQYLSAMLQKPPQSGREAADEMLSVSAKSCDALAPTQEGCGTPTLAIYNPEAAPESERALDQLGTELQLAIKDPGAKKAVDSLIGQIPDVSIVSDHLRDVDGFATGVINLIKRGTISDGDHRLQQAAQDVVNADRNLVRAFYVNPKSKIVEIVGQNHLTGLNTFLPGPQFDVRSEAEDMVNLQDSKTLPLQNLLDREIQRSLPDDYSGGWAGFVGTIRR